MKRNSELLRLKLNRAIISGEVPYKASREALRVLDVENDGDAGLDEVGMMQRGLDSFMEALDDLEAGSKAVARRVSSEV